MSDDEFDEESLRAAALKSMASKKTAPCPDQKFTPLPRPDMTPNVSGMQAQPIPSRVPFCNNGPMNFHANNPFQNQFNFRNHYNNSHSYNNNNYNNGYQVMNLVPPINQFRHQHHTRPPQFNYQLRPGNFRHQPPVFHNKSQFQPHPNHYNNQVPRNNRPVSNLKTFTNNNGETSHSQSSSCTQNDSNGSPTESRRLPERFSRIERSDSESEEDDRLDEFVDDDEKSRDSSVNEVTNYEVQTIEENQLKPDENDLVLSENVDYDDLLFDDEIKNNIEPSQSSQSSAVSVEEEVAHEDQPSPEPKSQAESDEDNEEEENVSEKREVTPDPVAFRRVVVVARDTPEKIPSPAKVVEVEKKAIKAPSPVPKVSEPVVPRKIRLKLDGDIDAIERRRLKFGSVDDSDFRGQGRSRRVVVSPGRRNVRVPSCDEEDDDRDSSPGPNRKKLRSFVVLKK